MNGRVQEWFQQQRGIKPETLKHFGVRADGDSVVFPYAKGLEKRRYGIPEGERRFSYPSGQSLRIYNSDDTGKEIVYICEGETDTLRLWQEVGNDRTGVVGIPGINGWKSEFIPLFKDAKTIYVILDNEPDYNLQERVEESYRGIHRGLGRRVKRIRLPQDTKDVCEFFDRYSIDSFRLLCSSVQLSAYTPLDFSIKPPEPDWFVHRLLAKGDICLMVGEPGTGKSWLSMDLACKVASERPSSWMGHNVVTTSGKILYIDEENPVDVVYSRLAKLGLTSDCFPHIRYLHNVGIRLDKDPYALIEESMAIQPDLIVIDSLTRVHTEDENNAGAMAKLFNEGIKPLARETGAGVLILHHAGKTDGTSYKRARGSGDIVASVDAAIDVRPISPGHVACYVFKSRRGIHEDPTLIKIEDVTPTSVRLSEQDMVEDFVL